MPKQTLGWFPVSLGLVMEDEPSEFSFVVSSFARNLKIPVLCNENGTVISIFVCFKKAKVVHEYFFMHVNTCAIVYY